MANKKVLVFILAVILVGCSKQTPEERFANAKDLATRGQSDTAIIELKTLLQESPNNIEAKKLLGFLLFDAGDLGGAESQLSRVLETQKEANDTLLTLQMALFHQRKYESVLLLSGSIERSLSPMESFVEYLSAKQAQSGEYKALLNAKGNADETTEILIDTYQQLYSGNVEAALENLPSSDGIPEAFLVEYYLLKSTLLKMTNQFDEASVVAGLASEKWPYVSTVGMNEVEILLANGQLIDAKAELDKWSKISPEAVWVNYFLGIVEANNQNYTDSLNYLEAAINGGLDSGDVWLLNGIVASQLKLWETAYTSFESSYARTKNNVALSLLAETQLQLGEDAQAVATIKQVIQNDRDWSAPYVKRAVTFLNYKGKGEEAVEVYEDYLGTSDDIGENLDEVIQLEVLKSKNGLPLAAKNLKTLLNKKADSPMAVYLNINERLENGDIVEARRLANGILKQNGDDVADLRALVEMEAKEYGLAVEYAKKKLSARGNKSLALRILMLSNYEMGDLAASFEAALSLATLEPLNKQAAVDTVALSSLINSEKLNVKLVDTIENFSEEFELLTEYATLLVRNGRGEEALGILKTNQQSLTVSGNQLLVSLLLEKRKFEEASIVVENWLSEDTPSKAAVMAKLGVLVSQGKYQDAVSYAQQMQDSFADDPRLEVFLFQLHKDNENYVDANLIIERLRSKSVPIALIELFKSELAIAQKQYEQATRHLENSHNNNPTYLTATTLTQMLMLKKNIEQAKKVMLSFYDQGNLRDERQYHTFAEFFFTVGETRTAIKIYKDMIDLGFDSAVLYANRAEALHKNQNYEEAISSSRIAAQSQQAEYILQLAEYLYASGDKDGALHVIEIGIAENNDSESERLKIATEAVNLGFIDSVESILGTQSK